MEIVIYLLLWAVIFYFYGKNRQLKILLIEKTKKQLDLCLSAMIMTEGEMKALWEAKVFYLQNKINSLKGQKNMIKLIKERG